MSKYLTQIQGLSHPNKYTKWYCNIIHQALHRSQHPAGQAHHILPRSFNLGGATDCENLVHLTFKEHYVAHLLLPKMLQQKQHINKMHHAIVAMCVGMTRNSNSPTNLYASRRFSIVRQQLIKSEVFSTGTNKTWVNDGSKSKRVRGDDLQHYITSGWEIGRHSFTRRTSININKDGATKRIEPRCKQQYILDGWVLGNAPRSTICVTDGTSNIYVEPTDIPEGYTAGSYQKTCEGRRWVTNGVTDVYLNRGQELPRGWHNGRSNANLRKAKLTNSGKIRINNGVVQQYQSILDPVPSGWVRGGLSPKKKWTWSKNLEQSTHDAQSLV